MLRTLTDEEVKEAVKELKEFCVFNHSLMYNFMREIKAERENAVEMYKQLMGAKK